MIVDDEPLFRDFLRLKMDWESYGFEICCEARNGREALQEADRHRPHLALVDINMPFMNGIELAVKLKEKFANIVIVFISGHNEFEYLQQAVRSGVQDYLLKPFNKDEMISMLERIKPQLPDLPKHHRNAEELSGEEDKASAPTLANLGFLHDSIILGLRMRDKETIEEVRKVVNELRGRPREDEYGEAMIMALVSLALSFASERGISYERVWENEENKAPYELVKALLAWDEVEEWMVSLYRKLFQLTADSKLTKASQLFLDALSYIEQHYANPDLSAEQVAGGVFVDPSYLRRVFRKESGHSIVDHITHVRMKEAKSLMRKGNLRLLEVAESVGYSDPNYFGKSFKKRFGMTPTEYEQLQKR